MSCVFSLAQASGLITPSRVKRRILYENIWKMLSAHKQMVFIAGPMQAGKTTFTQMLAEDFNNSLYFNWDILDEKRKLIESPFFMKRFIVDTRLCRL